MADNQRTAEQKLADDDMNPTNRLSAPDTERRWAAEDLSLDVVKAAFGGFTNPSEAYLLWQRKNPALMRGLLQAIAEALDAARRAGFKEGEAYGKIPF